MDDTGRRNEGVNDETGKRESKAKYGTPSKGQRGRRGREISTKGKQAINQWRTARQGNDVTDGWMCWGPLLAWVGGVEELELI